MELEAMAENVSVDIDDYVKIDIEMHDKLLIANWKSLILTMLDSTLTVSGRSSLFHASLANAILQQAKYIRELRSVNTVSFSGGVFQNRVLTEQAMALLSAEGFDVCLPELVPVNDAGISFGQVMEFGFTKDEKIKT
jgi:hydrogenase maturation protein HypF